MSLRALGSIFSRSCPRPIVRARTAGSSSPEAISPLLLHPDVQTAGKPPRDFCAQRSCSLDAGMALRHFGTHAGVDPAPVPLGALSTFAAFAVAGMLYMMAPVGASASSGVPRPEKEKLPEYVDWEEEGAVMTPWSQYICRGCWAYTAVGSVEGILKIRTGKLVKLSVQQVLDCAKKVERSHGKTHVVYGKGCWGGSFYRAYEYIQKHGLVAESSYPWRLLHGKCCSEGKTVVVKIDDFDYVDANEEALMQAVANQPVAVPIDVSPYFRGFKGDGIIEYEDCPPAADSDPDKLSHAILVVGYWHRQRWEQILEGQEQLGDLVG